MYICQLQSPSLSLPSHIFPLEKVVFFFLKDVAKKLLICLINGKIKIRRVTRSEPSTVLEVSHPCTVCQNQVTLVSFHSVVMCPYDKQFRWVYYIVVSHGDSLVPPLPVPQLWQIKMWTIKSWPHFVNWWERLQWSLSPVHLSCSDAF